MSDFQSGESLGGYISKAQWYLKTYFNRLIHENGYSVTVEQWTLLLIIWQNPGKTQTEIAKSALKDKTNVTRILDILEKNRYIVRRPDKADRRKYKIHITEDGEKIMKALFPVAEQVNKAASAGVKDIKSLHESLSNIIENLKVLM